MTTTKCPSKMPRLLAWFLIAIVAPAIFVLGFGANKKHQTKPQKMAMTVIESKGSAVVPTKSDETTFIYADAYTVFRNDAICKVEDSNGNEISITILRDQKPIRYEGRLVSEFSAIASFIPEGDSVRVYCDLTSNTSGEFLVGEEITPASISIWMILFFMLGFVIMGIGCSIWIKNVSARKKWFEEHAKNEK